VNKREYEKRLAIFEDSVLDMVEHVVEELIEDHDGRYINARYTVSENEAKLTIYVPVEVVKEVIGKRGEILAAIRKIAYRVAKRHGFFLVLSIESYD
jgi:predicted RNA-binding protein YlqC (UPF0109 family)